MTTRKQQEDAYQSRMTDLANRVGDVFDGEDVVDAILVMTRLLTFAADEMPDNGRRRETRRIIRNFYANLTKDWD